MKRSLFWIFFCFCIQSISLGVSCREEEICEHRKYGYRRALLLQPTITTPVQSYSYETYFLTTALQATRLRNHLLATEALSREVHESDEREQLIKDLAYASLIPSIFSQAYQEQHPSHASNLHALQQNVENRKLEFAQQNVTTRSQTALSAHAAAPKNPKKDKRSSQRGKDLKDAPSAEEMLQQEIRKIEEAAREKAQKIQRDFASKASNVCSFGFVFFDQEGHVLNERPFHFSPNATPDSLEDPFFFFSGRRYRNYNPALDFHPWTALPETAPKYTDLSLLPSKPMSVGKPEDMRYAFKGILPECSVQGFQGLQKILKMAYESYHNSLTGALKLKASYEPFFDCVYNRFAQVSTQTASNDVVAEDEVVCPVMCRLLDLPTSTIGESPPIYHYPQKAENNNTEGDFTHSEQYALFKASSTFESFLDACVTRLHQITHLSAPDSEKTLSPRIVSSCAVLLYTHNTMCVRCAQSVIADFIQKISSVADPRLAFNALMSQKFRPQTGLFSQEEARRIPMVFMAGYTYAYASTLYKNLPDHFEKWTIRQQALQQGEALPTDSGVIPFDMTCGEEEGELGGYSTCSPEESPQMVYHVRIQSSSSSTSSTSSSSSSHTSSGPQPMSATSLSISSSLI